MPYDVFIGCPDENGAAQSEESYAQLDASQVRQLVNDTPDMTYMQHDENVAGDKRLRVFLLRNNRQPARRVDSNPNGVPPEMLPQVTEALRDVLSMMERKATELGVGFGVEHGTPAGQPAEGGSVNGAAATTAQMPQQRISPVRIHIFSAPGATSYEQPPIEHHFGVESETTGKELVSASKQIRRLKSREHRLRRLANARIRRAHDAKFERLRVSLAKQLETESYFRARFTVWRMLRLRPRHSEARLARAFLKEQVGIGAFIAALLMFFPDLFYVLKEEFARTFSILLMPFSRRRRAH